MKRFIVMLTIFICCLILPGTLFHYWSWAGIKPDLAMLWVLYFALHYRVRESVGMGFASGLVVDLYLGRYIGLHAMTFVVVALLVSFLQQRWYRDNIPLTMLLVFMVTVLGQSIIVLNAALSGLSWFYQDALKIILGISFYNALLVPLTYPFLHKSFTSGMMQQKSKYELL